MRPTHIFKILRSAIFIIALFFCEVSAYAASKDQTVTLAQEIMQVTVETSNLESTPIDDISDTVMDIIYQRRSDNLQNYLDSLEDKASLTNFDLFARYAEITNNPIEGLVGKDGYETLVNEINSKSWRRSYLSNLLLAQLHLGKGDVLKVLEYTGKSLEIVSQQVVTPESTSMLYDIYDILQTAYIYDRSTDQAIEAMSALKDLSVKAGRSLDGFSLVNNLAVLFSKDGRNKDAIEIMSVMGPYLEGQPKEKIILYNFSIAKFKNRASLYSEALPHLKKIETIGRDTWLMPYIYNELSQSYAYLGQIEKSESIMKLLDALPAEKLPKSDLFQLSIINVKSQIAEKRGEYKTALKLQNEYSQRSIERISSAQFQDRKKAAGRIAISQRVATQKLEHAANASALKDTIIDREKNLNRISMGLLTLAAIMVGLLVYGVRKQKMMNKTLEIMNGELAVSRDKALASEKAKSNFLSVMSHEIRTPLNSIIPVAELLKAKSQDRTDSNLLSLIVMGGNTLLQMLDNVLVLSKGEDAGPEYTEDLSPVKIAKPILKDYGDEAHKKGIRFSAKAEKGFPLSVHTDKKALEKILVNILSNAVKFTSEGHVSVIFSRAEDENYFSMKIKDTGIGMRGENLEELLEPFTQKDTGMTRSYDGLGIGLSVTNIEAMRLGGRLIINTDLDVGTEVEVILPIAAQVMQTAPLEVAA